MNRYLTTTLPYVNGDPHIGFALEILHADVLARTWRLQGDAVFFTTGTDEHGQKIFEAAEKKGEEVQAYVDHYAAEFRKLRDALSLSNDTFVRTSDQTHCDAAQEMWRLCDAAGDIYEKTYTGMYCAGCEAFKTEHEILPDGHCELHPTLEVTELNERNYFFRFSKYADRLLKYLERPNVIVPEWRRAEAIAFVKSGLEDFSISREKERLTWGVPVPGDDTQVMYVWFDALTNYISVLGWPEDVEGNFAKFWNDGHTLQVAGKDQVRFQSLMWQAMLMSANIKGTDQVFYHGFINSGGQKMSKSIGNVISPYDLIAKYGTEATRYALLRHVHPVDDSDVTWERLDEWYTANLVNGLGNLASRVMKLAETHLTEPVQIPEPVPFDDYFALINVFEFSHAADMVWERIQKIDERITHEAPFKVVKEDPEKGREMITDLCVELYWIARMLQPFMPTTSDRITDAIKDNKKPDNLFPRLDA